MNAWLVDTNVLSELRRKRPDQRVVRFVSAQPLESLHVSTVTFAEIRYGIERVQDPARRTELHAWLAHELRPLFTGRTVEVTEDVMLEWRLLVETGRRSGHTFSQPDLIIAAQARLHGLTIVSRDTREYEHAHAPVMNPWH